MLYRVIVNNYKSFAEEQQFDMFPNPKRENFPCHVLKSKQNIPVLKECAIYGANGSGKSNFIKLLQFLKDFVTEDMFSLQKLNNWYHFNRFKLPIAKNNTPIEILIEFGINEIVYIYSLSIDDKGVKEEKLYLSGKGYNEEVLVFSRNYSDIEFTITHISPEIENIFKRQLSSNPAASVLGINGTLRLIDNEIINNAYTWFDKNLKIVSFNRQIPWLIELFKANDELLKFVNKVFTNIGLGINSLDIKESNINDWIENHKQEDSNKNQDDQQQNQNDNSENNGDDKQSKTDENRESSNKKDSDASTKNKNSDLDKEDKQKAKSLLAKEGDENEKYDEEAMAMQRLYREIPEDVGGLLREFIKKEYMKDRYNNENM